MLDTLGLFSMGRPFIVRAMEEILDGDVVTFEEATNYVDRLTQSTSFKAFKAALADVPESKAAGAVDFGCSFLNSCRRSMAEPLRSGSAGGGHTPGVDRGRSGQATQAMGDRFDEGAEVIPGFAASSQKASGAPERRCRPSAIAGHPGESQEYEPRSLAEPGTVRVTSRLLDFGVVNAPGNAKPL